MLAYQQHRSRMFNKLAAANILNALAQFSIRNAIFLRIVRVQFLDDFLGLAERLLGRA
jgi:hypothetical protein